MIIIIYEYNDKTKKQNQQKGMYCRMKTVPGIISTVIYQEKLTPG